MPAPTVRPPRAPLGTDRAGLLARFRRDASGNALAIMAAAILPMTAAVGGAIDISRNYMAQSRLQQACDAGVLAGRRAQGGDQWSSAAATEAANYFKVNYPTGLYESQNITFTPRSTNANEVSGVATAFIPGTVGKVIGYQGQALSVNCTARLDLTNTDVMFVLDTSGSMREPSGSDGTTRINALTQAVRDFAGVLETAKRPDTQVRYGFVAYANSVNVGPLLVQTNPDLVAGSHTYQVREWLDGPFRVGVSDGECRYNGGAPSGGDCIVSGVYRHIQRSLDVRSLRSGGTMVDPTARNPGDWDWTGCIEERGTVATNRFDPLPAGAWDLNVDAGAGSDERRWKVQIPFIYRRPGTNSAFYLERRSDEQRNNRNCPSGRSELVRPRTAGEIATYLNTLSPDGGTYHDVGMIWGLRLLSPDGIWANHNRSSTNVLPITRHIIFMTDGIMSPSPRSYSAYGVEDLDQRVGGPGASDAELLRRHNARFLAMCALARAKGVRVWTVAFGTSLSDTQLVECADTGRAFEAANGTELNSTFRRIATRISDLRLEQ